VVLEVVLHPRRLSRADYPGLFFKLFNLIVLGSRKLNLRLRQTFDSEPGPAGAENSTASVPDLESRRTIGLFVAGQRDDLKAAAQKILSISPDSLAFQQMTLLETVNPLDSSRRLKLTQNSTVDFFEVALQRLPGATDDFPLKPFRAYAEAAGFSVHLENSLLTERLIFAPVRGPRSLLPHLAEFVFVREIKEIGRLRSLTPPDLALSSKEASISLPPPPDPSADSPKVAILDAGLPDKHPLGLWARDYVKVNPDSADYPEGPTHGLAVASAFLFGPIPEKESPAQPWAPITFYRVLDAESGKAGDLDRKSVV
jgi:hypothetical protein